MERLPSKTPALLQDLYSEVQQVVLLELPHTSLSMISILLEATLREIIKKKKGKYPTGATFNKCIFILKDASIISEKQVLWLKKMNNLVRNSYVHHDVERIADNIKTKNLDPEQKKAFDRLVAQELFLEVDRFIKEMIEKNF